MPCSGRAVHALPVGLGRLKVPRLRNIAVTAPCMHDGRIMTLEHCAIGGRAGHGGWVKIDVVSVFVLRYRVRDDGDSSLRELTDGGLQGDPWPSEPWYVQK